MRNCRRLVPLLLASLVVLMAGMKELAGGADPMVELSTLILNFNGQAPNTTSAPQKALLANIGTAPLLITDISVTGADRANFIETNNCPKAPAALAIQKSCTIQVQFRPTARKVSTAVLSVTDNAAGSPQSVQIWGTVLPPSPQLTFSPRSLAFGKQPISSTSTPLTVLLNNSTSQPLTITSPVSITGQNAGEFVLVPGGSTCPLQAGKVKPNGTCRISVAFSPLTQGTKSARITIEDDVMGSPHEIPMMGIGGPPQSTVK